MKYPTNEQADGAAAERTAPTFDLRPRALRFARLYAEHPQVGATQCAVQAGYSRRSWHGAHVRASELLRDPRVIRAVLYFGARAFNSVRAQAMQQLARLATSEARLWTGWDGDAFARLNRTLAGLDSHLARLEKVHEKAHSKPGPPVML